MPALAAALVYAPSLSLGWAWDDDLLIAKNPALHDLDGLLRLLRVDMWQLAEGSPGAYHRPVGMASYWLNAQIALSPKAFHAGNVLLHALDVALFAWVLRDRAKLGAWATAIAASLFAVHPALSEPTLWVSDRFDLLCAGFALAAVLVTGGPIERRRRLLFPLFVALGVGSKESFVGILPFLFVVDLMGGGSMAEKGIGARARRIAPLQIAALGAAAMMLLLRARSGAQSAGAALAVGPRALLEGLVFLMKTQAEALVAPVRLDPFRPYVAPRGVELVVLSSLATLALGAALVAARRRAMSPVVPLGLAFYGLALAPMASTGPTLGMTGDRYLYVPALGLFAALAVGAERLVQWRAVARAPVVALAAALAAITVVHIPDWKDDEALARSSLRANPDNPYALYSLGVLALDRGDIGRAFELVSRSVALDPGAWRGQSALCVIALRRGALAVAERACLASLAKNGQNHRTWSNVASVYLAAGLYEPCVAYGERAVALRPDYGEIRCVLATCEARRGRREEAAPHLAACRALAPGTPALAQAEDAMR